MEDKSRECIELAFKKLVLLTEYVQSGYDKSFEPKIDEASDAWIDVCNNCIKNESCQMAGKQDGYKYAR